MPGAPLWFFNRSWGRSQKVSQMCSIKSDTGEMPAPRHNRSKRKRQQKRKADGACLTGATADKQCKPAVASSWQPAVGSHHARGRGRPPLPRPATGSRKSADVQRRLTVKKIEVAAAGGGLRQAIDRDRRRRDALEHHSRGAHRVSHHTVSISHRSGSCGLEEHHGLRHSVLSPEQSCS